MYSSSSLHGVGVHAADLKKKKKYTKHEQQGLDVGTQGERPTVSAVRYARTCQCDASHLPARVTCVTPTSEVTRITKDAFSH